MDGPVAPETFAIHVGKYDRKVADFEPMSAEQLQQRLIGRAAPPFTTLNLEGKEVTLASFKGKVVLLDFWATFCGPCIMSMPHIQKLSEKYAKEPVVIAGVNGDTLPPATQPASPAARFKPIADFVKSRKLTYLQLMDPEGTIAGDYRVEGIPVVFLIDKEGVTRSIHMGYSEAAPEIFAHEIDLLLKGQPIPPPATQAEREER